MIDMEKEVTCRFCGSIKMENGICPECGRDNIFTYVDEKGDVINGL